MNAIKGECLVPGTAAGRVLRPTSAQSSRRAVVPGTGTAIVVHHLLRGENVSDTILAIPSGRGSCSGSLAMFQLLLNGHAPKALLFQHKETILTLGVVIASELFAKQIPVVCLPPEGFAALAGARYAVVSDGAVTTSDVAPSTTEAQARLPELDLSGFELNDTDRRFLAGEFGAAGEIAIRIII